MDTEPLIEPPFVPRDPCTCYKGLPECPACRAWAEDHGRRCFHAPLVPSVEDLTDRMRTLHYLQERVAHEQRTKRSLERRLAHYGVLSPDKRLLLLETRAMLLVHQQQRDALLYPKKGRPRGKPLVAD